MIPAGPHAPGWAERKRRFFLFFELSPPCAVQTVNVDFNLLESCFLGGFPGRRTCASMCRTYIGQFSHMSRYQGNNLAESCCRDRRPIFFFRRTNRARVGRCSNRVSARSERRRGPRAVKMQASTTGKPVSRIACLPEGPHQQHKKKHGWKPSQTMENHYVLWYHYGPDFTGSLPSSGGNFHRPAALPHLHHSTTSTA